MGLCDRTLNYSYGGDSVGPTPFLNAIKLLKSMYENNAHDDTLKAFIMAKLTGNALDCVPREPANIDEIVTTSQNFVKPEGSKVIAGRMMALRVDKANFSEYVKKTEELADCFKETFIGGK